MDYGLSGKTALVMSSTSGLGLACALALAQEGVQVVINGRDPRVGARALERLPGTPRFVAADITDADDRARLVDEASEYLGDIAILVSNGGGPAASRFQETSTADWTDGFNLVVVPAIDVIQRCVPQMMASGWGRVVSLSSISGKEVSLMGSRPNALRPALVGALGTLAREIASAGVTVNSILSGPFDTPALRSVVRQHSGRLDLSEEEAVRVYAEAGPMKRIGRTEELGALCAFLCSDRAGYITGQSIVIDGGRVATLY